MSTAGWIMILISWTVIFSLVIFCYSRIFGARREKPEELLEKDTKKD